MSTSFGGFALNVPHLSVFFCHLSVRRNCWELHAGSPSLSNYSCVFALPHVNLLISIPNQNASLAAAPLLLLELELPCPLVEVDYLILFATTCDYYFDCKELKQLVA